MATPRRSSDGAAALLRNAQGGLAGVANGDMADEHHRLSKAISIPLSAVSFGSGVDKGF